MAVLYVLTVLHRGSDCLIWGARAQIGRESLDTIDRLEKFESGPDCLTQVIMTVLYVLTVVYGVLTF